MTNWINNIMFVIGIVAIVYGLYLIHPPCSYIFGGTALCIISKCEPENREVGNE